MPYIQITEKLRDIIKLERKKAKIRGDELSKDLGKSASYISQIENGRITNIEVEIFYKIFEHIINLPEDSRNAYINQILDNTPTDNIEEEEWMITFDMQYRMFKIPDKIIELIIDKRTKLKMTSQDLVKYINKNEGTEEFDKIEPNQLKLFIHERGIGYTIKFKFELDFIDKIENKQIQFTSYIFLLGIIFRLFALEGKPDFEAIELAENVLRENDILTIIEREALKEQNKKQKIEKGEAFKEEDIEPTELDRQYTSNMNKIIRGFNFTRDLNASFAVKVTSKISENMNVDTGFMLQLYSLPFNNLEFTSREKKIDFINEIRTLIDKYSKNDELEDILSTEIPYSSDPKKM